jgi:hypothetical protein
MSLVYFVEKICYVLPQNEFYELLRLENLEEPHNKKYNWLIMKGNFGTPPQIKASLIIDDRDEEKELHPEISSDQITVGKLPALGNEIALRLPGKNVYDHFSCEDILQDPLNPIPMIVANFMGAFKSVKEIINLWCDAENKLLPLL